MAKLDRLNICGIRSFGPNEEDVQIVKFSSPLTLFLGQNGCGKTTIIECLKYACTNALPAGTSNGQGFVNDPKLNSAPSTKGQVRLRFNDIQGNTIIICKSVQVMRKAVNLQFKNIDSTYKKIDKKTGQESLVSATCANINPLITQSLGVSDSILNNVVFCHQEDALWPLDEGKKMKEKFDEIFNSAKYGKYIDSLRKLIKDKRASLNIFEVDFKNKKDIKEIVDRKQALLQEKQETLRGLNVTIREYEIKLHNTNTELQRIRVIETNISELEKQLSSKESEKSSLIEQQKMILKNIRVEFEGSDEQLQHEIQTFESNADKINEKCKGLEREERKLKEDESSLSTLKNKEQVKLGRLQETKKQNDQRIEERNLLVNKLVEEKFVNIPVTFSTSFQVTAALSAFSSALEESKSSLKSLEQQFETEENNLQHAIDGSHEKVLSTKQNISGYSQQIDEVRSKKRNIDQQLCQINVSDEQSKNLRKKISEIESDLEVLKSSIDTTVLSGTIVKEQKDMGALETQLEDLEQENRILQKNSIAEADLENQKHEVAKRGSEICDRKTKHYEKFMEILGEIPENNLHRAVQECKQLHSRQQATFSKEIGNVEREITSHKTKQRIINDQLIASNKELQSYQNEMEAICKGKPFNEIIHDLHQNIEKLQRDKGQYSSGKIIYESFIQKFESETPCCPVCHSNFANKETAVAEIIATIRHNIKQIPRQLELVESNLKSHQKTYSDLLQKKPISEKIDVLGTKTIPSLQNELEVLNDNLEKANGNLIKLEDALKDPERKLDLCNAVMADATLIDQYKSDIKKSQEKIVQLESQIIQLPSNRTRQQVEIMIRNIKTDFSNLRRSWELSQKKLHQHHSDCQEKTEERNKLVQNLLQIEKAMQGKPQLEDQLKELNNEEKLLKTKITQFEGILPGLLEAYRNCVADKKTTKDRNKLTLAATETKYNLNQRKVQEIEKLQKLINRHESDKIDEQFNSVIDELTKIKQRETDLTEEKAKTVESIIKIKSELQTQENTFRQLTDNLTLRERRKQESKILTAINELKTEIGNYNYKALLPEKLKLLKAAEGISKDIEKSNGRYSELELSIQELQKELDQPNFKKAYSNYKSKYFEMASFQRIIEDLDVYLKALEVAILKFHAEQMIQINSTIRELWTSIYKGNDIDYIQIKTEQCLGSAKRRVYNYKVVQLKYETELEMRGRCSAGQKILACLIIRMALAETFSHNCGILALDEPTTNLDRENIAGLSEALARIINSRQAEKNFQLLVITHDEEFLNALLTRVDKISYYWKVSRNERGKSMIRKEML